ncbi:hypothetical protein Tco_1276668 [Tanacetum coccineum]
MDNVRPRASSSSPPTRFFSTFFLNPFIKSKWVKKESTAGTQAVLPQTKGEKGSVGNPKEELKDHAIIDSGCSGSMTGDKDKLSDFKDYKGGYVAFGNDPKGGRITGKGTIKTSCIDFENVLFSSTIVAISSTEAEYVAAASCCGHVLWMQNQLFDYGFNFMNTEIHIDNESAICIVKNPVFHSKTKHIQIRHHFIRDCYDQRLINVVKVHTDDNVADLLTKGFDLARLTLPINTLTNFKNLSLNLSISYFYLSSPNLSSLLIFEIMAIMNSCNKHNMIAYVEKTERNTDFHEVIDFLTRCSVNYALMVSPNVIQQWIQQFWSTTKVIWDMLQDIGYEGSLTLLPFSKPLFSPQWKYLVHTLLHCLSSKSSSWDQFGTNIASALVGLATNQKFNFSKLIFDGMLRNLKDSKPFLMYPRFIQLFLNKQLEGITQPQNFLPTVVLPSKVFTFMSKCSPKFSGKLTPLTPYMLEVATASN